MSIRNIGRILREISHLYPGEDKITRKEFRLAVDIVGTTYQCYKHYLDTMLRRGLIKAHYRHYLILTQKGMIGIISKDDEDIEEVKEKKEEPRKKDMITSCPKREDYSQERDIDEDYLEE